jgi:hypothetical protein
MAIPSGRPVPPESETPPKMAAVVAGTRTFASPVGAAEAKLYPNDAPHIAANAPEKQNVAIKSFAEVKLCGRTNPDLSFGWRFRP